MSLRGCIIVAALVGVGFFVVQAAVPWPHVASDTLITVHNEPVDLRSAEPDNKRVGKLIYRGGVSVVPETNAFGGLSSLKISADGTRFVSAEDEGVWVTGRLTYDDKGDLTGMADVHLAPEILPNGSPIDSKDEGDSEGLAFADPLDVKGDAFLSYEGDNRVMRYDFAKDGMAARGQPFAMPPAIKTLRHNTGIEVLAGLPNGKLLAMSEEGPRDKNQDSLGWVVDEATGTATSFIVKRNLPYALTDATYLPDGRVLVLSRRFDFLSGVGAQIRVFDPATFKEGATVDGPVIAELFHDGLTVDNMEGIAARKTPDGKTLIYIISDDNFNRPLQRTLLMMFELAE